MVPAAVQLPPLSMVPAAVQLWPSSMVAEVGYRGDFHETTSKTKELLSSPFDVYVQADLSNQE